MKAIVQKNHDYLSFVFIKLKLDEEFFVIEWGAFHKFFFLMWCFSFKLDTYFCLTKL